MRVLSLGMVVMLICMGFFAYDATMDVVGHLTKSEAYSLKQKIHLLFEVLAGVGLGYGAFVTWRYNQLLQQTTDMQRQKIVLLKGSLQELIERRFEEWRLTNAEREVTLFLIKGFSTVDIADIRKTAEGTVKTQISSIFRKIGVRSRAELMSVFMDEFLDNSDEKDEALLSE